MRPPKKFLKSHQLLIFIIFIFFLAPWKGADAQTFCVADSGELQSALDQAGGNGESDVIQVAAGTYVGNFTYTTQGDDHLTLTGGYTAGCTGSITDASKTVIDGNLAGTALAVDIDGAGDFECSHLTFRNGSATQGGGLNAVSQNGSITINNTQFTNNHATEFGGGLYLNANKAVTLIYSTIADNKCDYYAAGASIHGNAILTFNGNTVKNNTADGAVGGLWTSAGSVTITNSLFAFNSGNWYNGAILTDSDSVQIINNTIAANTAGGVGAGLSLKLTDDTDTALVLNNIIFGNSGNAEANDLHILNDDDGNAVASSVTLANNNFDQSAAGTLIQIPFAIDGSNLSNEVPLFNSQATGDFKLKKGSPCIDKGTSANAPALDMVGTARAKGKAVDMGAYEYNEYPLPSITANGQAAAISVSFGDPVSLSVGLDPKDLVSLNADWWLVAVDPGGNAAYLDLTLGAMTQGLLPTYQGGLFSLNTTPLLSFSDLAVGQHTFYFAVDMNMNNALDLSDLYYDLVVVDVNQ